MFYEDSHLKKVKLQEPKENFNLEQKSEELKKNKTVVIFFKKRGTGPKDDKLGVLKK